MNREIKELWVVQGGVNRKIFSRAVEWTYSISKSNGAASGTGNSVTETAILSTNNYSGSEYFDEYVQVEYDFKEPLLLPAGSALTSVITKRYDIYSLSFKLLINGAAVATYSLSGSTESRSETYTVQADISVSNISIRIDASAPPTSNGQANLALTVPANGATFLLNNSGTSDQ